MTFVSVIIVNLNGEKHLKACLDSLKAIEHPKDRMEVIVFDNGSRDDSLGVVRKTHPQAVVIEHRANLGFAAPHRIAAEAARGDVLALLNNDMKVDRAWIKEGLSRLDPEEGIVCSSSKILSWDGKQIDFSGGTLQYLGYADQLRDGSVKNGESLLFPCGGAMFIQKKAFVESGGFDDDYFAIFEDVDLGWRLWLMGYKVVMATNSITYHKSHATLDSKREEKKRYLMHRNALMTIVKNYADENLKKILPLALILSVKRTLLFLGLDKRAFHFWEESAESIPRPDNYVEGCLHLAVLDDVFESFEKLMEKRLAVQVKRKRDDTEIFSLFKDPFRNIMGYKEYLWEEASLFGHFGLEEVFKCRDEYGERLDEAILHARKTLKTLTSEIRSMALQMPVHVRDKEDVGSLAKKFLSNLRESGLGAAVKKTGKYLKRRLG